MSTIAFVPRSVKRRKIDPQPAQDQVSTSVVSKPTPAGAPIASGDLLPRRDINRISEGKGRDLKPARAGAPEHEHRGVSANPIKSPALEDLSLLVWLALSDYALWSDVDLRRKIDWASDTHNSHEEEGATNGNGIDRGYIPLAYLLKHSSAFLSASTSPLFANQPETLYVKALRIHASHLVDVRLIVSDDGPFGPATSHWAKHTSPTGYEVRRTTTGDLHNHGKADWEKLTVYVENIPIQYRNLAGATKFIVSLLPSSSEKSITRVQNTFFPPHHNDKPGLIPACKGFALVVLSSAEDAQFLLEEWPWDLRKLETKAGLDEELEDTDSHSVFRREAQKFGLRCLSKANWEELKAEYLHYRQQLAEELNTENEAQEKIGKIFVKPKNYPPEASPVLERLQFEPKPEPSATRETEHPKPEPIHVGSQYPSGCLVFVRNVHPETNKTTLRALFSQAWSMAEDPDVVAGAAGLDYVDYMKGLDTCHVRLGSQSHTGHFIDYFATHSITQTSGLDGVGMQLPTSGLGDANPEALSLELVLGRREEVYWEKVPQKVRKQAVERALKSAQGPTGNDDEGAGRKRKRGRGQKG